MKFFKSQEIFCDGDSRYFRTSCLLNLILEPKWYLESLQSKLKEQLKAVSGDHLSMVLRQFRDHAHRVQRNDPKSLSDDIKQKLDIYDKKFEIETLTAPRGFMDSLIVKIRKFENLMEGNYAEQLYDEFNAIYSVFRLLVSKLLCGSGLILLLSIFFVDYLD